MTTLAITIIALSIACWVCAVMHPVALFVVLWFLQKRIKSPEPGLPKLKIDRLAFVTCAYREGRSIREKINNHKMLQEAYPGAVFGIYVDGEDEVTMAEIKAAAFPELKVLSSKERKGKAHGMNTLLTEFNDVDVVCFSDANTYLSREAPGRALRYLEDPKVGCVSGSLVAPNRNRSGVGRIAAIYWELEERIKAKQSRIYSATMADGGLFFARRMLIPPIPADTIDDMHTSLSIALGGHRIIQASDVTAQEKVAERVREEFKRKVRIACRAVNCHKRLRPKIKTAAGLFKTLYLTHKPLRWGLCALCVIAAPAFLVGLALLAIEHPIAAAIIAAGAFGALMLRPIYAAIASVWGSGLGVWQAVFGKNIVTWTPPQSAR